MCSRVAAYSLECTSRFFTIKQTNLPLLSPVSHCADFRGCLQGCLAPQSSANMAMAAFIKHHNHILITASPMHKKNAGTSHSGVLCNCLIDPYRKLTVSALMGRHDNIQSFFCWYKNIDVLPVYDVSNLWAEMQSSRPNGTQHHVRGNNSALLVQQPIAIVALAPVRTCRE